MGSLIDLTGQKFARLTVIRKVTTKSYRSTRWECRCDCGTVKDIDSKEIRSGHTRSCGCLQRELAKVERTIHGEYGSVEYNAWQYMKGRCTNSNSEDWKHYGGRGIRVCEEWQDDYLAFLAYVGRRPSAEHSIDRIDNDGDYEPGNVKWSTKKEQIHNRSCSKN